MVIALLFAAAAAQPSADALRLGRQLAERGTLATLLPMMQQKETEELVSQHPELTTAERAQLRATAQSVFEKGRERLMSAEGESYARRLSLADLKVIVRFQNSEAGKRYRAAIPNVIVDTMKLVGSMDFKADVSAAYCKASGKLCAR
jgi:hypothetical protein